MEKFPLNNPHGYNFSMSVDMVKTRFFSVFSQVSPETVDVLSKYMVEKNCSQGELIQVEGEDCQWVGFIIRGAVRVFRSAPNGREQVLHNLGPGMQINAIPALNGNAILKASARALTQVSLYTISSEDYRTILKSRADFAYAAVVDFARRLERMTSLVEDLSLRSVRGRLARFLLDEADRGSVSEQWTQDEIASRLGTVRDVIGRTLRGFMDAGLVRREGNRLILVDRAGLEAEAES